MAPELFNLDEGKSGLCTRGSDIFALGMVTIEVRNIYRGRSFSGSEAFSCTSPQLFTGQVPFSENSASPIVIKRIIEGDRPSRPSRGRKLGLSDELWELVQSSWVPEAEERTSVSAFVDLLRKATPNVTVLKALTKFDATSEEDIQKLCHVFDYEDNTLLGMREEDTLVLIEVFDRVSFSTHYLFTPPGHFQPRSVPGPEFLFGGPYTSQPVSIWASEGFLSVWPSPQELLDFPQRSRRTS